MIARTLCMKLSKRLRRALELYAERKFDKPCNTPEIIRSIIQDLPEYKALSNINSIINNIEAESQEKNQ